MDAPTLPAPAAPPDASAIDVVGTEVGASDATAPGTEWSDPALRTLLPEHIGRRYQAVPLRREDGVLIVGMVTPGDLRAVDDLRALLDRSWSRTRSTSSRISLRFERSSKKLPSSSS
jgi:hypothetical protein